jgi:ankyrin repeat protein
MKANTKLLNRSTCITANATLPRLTKAKQKTLNRALFEAIYANDEAEVCSLLKAGADVTATIRGVSVLSAAVGRRRRCRYGYLAAFDFSEPCSPSIQSALLTIVAARDLNAVHTCFIEAMLVANDVAVVRAFLAYVSLDEAAMVLVREQAIRNPNLPLEGFKLLFTSPEHVNFRDLARRTPLHLAVECGLAERVDYLLDCGAKVDARHHGNTALHYIQYCGYLLPQEAEEIVQALLKHGADPELLDGDDCSITEYPRCPWVQIACAAIQQRQLSRVIPRAAPAPVCARARL